jgi:DNA-binding CsgD family transcriptional regulator
MSAEPATTPDVRALRLSCKEQACLRLVARRLSSKQIAAELGIAKTSVDTYCNRARAKLGVTDRYEAARLLEAALGPAEALARDGPVAGASQPRRAMGPAQRRTLAVLASVLLIPLALALLFAGLRAFETMKPDHLSPLYETRVSGR